MSKDKSVGGIWVRQGSKGEFLSISIEINGMKHAFVAFQNGYKKPGSNEPDWRVLPGRERTNDATEAPTVDHMDAQLALVMAEKQKRQAAASATHEQTSFTEEPAPSFNETDCPF